MLKLLIALTAFASIHLIVFGIPADVDVHDLEDQELSATNLGDIFQVAAFFPTPPSGPKEFTVVTFLEVNWYAAEHICSQYGLTLASLTSRAEVNQLQEYLSKNGFNNERFWISGNNLSGQHKWFWFSNGRALTYGNWAYQPQNASISASCLLVYPDEKWYACDCNAKHYFVCENRCTQTY